MIKTGIYGHLLLNARPLLLYFSDRSLQNLILRLIRAYLFILCSVVFRSLTLIAFNESQLQMQQPSGASCARAFSYLLHILFYTYDTLFEKVTSPIRVYKKKKLN